MTKYKVTALFGLVLMGIGSFLSCLAATAPFSNAGSGLLLVSIAIMAYAFYHWRP